ncbi:MAG: hypothetical protein IMF26_00220 [Candidatus Fermentithermobacillus carboniphilus]|uniref:Uncharacterized protein n=1 Tax=Candidatus Fermentithermobacillus carboniphilus TaxID=3085328 RepID=A0AAT9LFC7_9FIRM|nr:MAG: hypothetical protein IMF26_00220 [Candidatus Fermentithermobacillus carboniphilus]
MTSTTPVDVFISTLYTRLPSSLSRDTLMTFPGTACRALALACLGPIFAISLKELLSAASLSWTMRFAGKRDRSQEVARPFP